MDKFSITFLSNFLLHHQTPFCEAMVRRLGDSFHFVATVPIPEERLKMGYHDYTNATYAINAYEDEVQHQIALKLSKESDVVILGDAPNEYVISRLKEGKLTFRYAERFFKEGRWHILDPRVFRNCYKNNFRYRNANYYMLCASAYTAQDCRFILSYPNKTYRWGYFPEVEQYPDVEKIIGSKKVASILWVGRMIGWKHPEDTIYLAEKLKSVGISFELNIIGEGELKASLVELVQKKGLTECVHFLDFMSPEQVRKWMERADIYLFTSDKNEGWGAVLNESMNSACAVVACKEIGSVPYLIEDGVNGFIYDRKKKNEMYLKVRQLLNDSELKHTMQKKAYETIALTWNADSAADRLLHLINCLQKGETVEYTSGPCSRDF